MLSEQSKYSELISKAQIKYIKSLRLKKNREIHKQFICEGVKIVDELLGSTFKVDSLYATKRKMSQLTAEWKLFEVSEEELNKISFLETPNEILAIAEIPEAEADVSSLRGELTLMLDGISDPGNMGTIIRIADWFGIKTIICSDGCVDVYNPKVVQASMGSIMRVKCVYVNAQDFLKELRVSDDYKIYGAILGGESIYSRELTDKGIIIIGNESKGISPEILGYVTEKITIPGYPSDVTGGRAESLNASVAAGIICAEFRRRISGGD